METWIRVLAVNKRKGMDSKSTSKDDSRWDCERDLASQWWSETFLSPMLGLSFDCWVLSLFPTNWLKEKDIYWLKNWTVHS